MVDPAEVLRVVDVDRPTSIKPVGGGQDTLLWRVETPAGTYALRLMRAEQAGAAQREQAAMRAAAVAGLPVPALHRVATWRERPVMLLSWCPGRTVMAELQARPWRIWALSRRLGRAQARLNRIAAPTDIPPIWLERAGDASVEARLRAMSLDQSRLLHLDFHPLNTMTDGSHITGVLDWTNTSAGDPRADAARTLAVLLLSPVSPGTSPVFAVMRRLLAAAWQSGYTAEAGRQRDMAPFHAWAAAAMLREMARRVGDPGHWMRDHQLEPARRWLRYWRQRV